MQTRNTLLDDLARVASGVLGVAAGARREAEELLRQRFAAVLARGDFVTGDEFDAVKAMAAKARADLDTVADRLAVLESARAKRAGKAAAKPRAGRGPAAG
jgi:BMFP domain-containing protein YqiC